MAKMLRVTAVWNGFPGAPGYSNFYFDSAIVAGPSVQPAYDKTRTFFSGIAGTLPPSVNIAVLPTVAEIDAANGAQTDEFSITTPGANIAGSGGTSYAGPSGACIQWKTSTFVNGRRLRGRTFVVPLAAGAYETDGTLTAQVLTFIRNAADALRNDAVGPSVKLGVWHRPVGGAGGTFAPVTASSVTDRVAVLTSRR